MHIRFPSTFVSAIALAVALAPAPSWSANVQAPNLMLPASAASNKQAVVDIFTSSYGAYKKYAWGHDEVKPISKTPDDPRNGWGATIVDAMTTMNVMGLNDLFAEAVQFAGQINFQESKTSDDVSVFESTIRYVAGLISSYELSGAKYPQLINKAQELTDRMLKIAFSKGTVIPYGHVQFATNSPIVATSNIAEAGTLTLEYSRLSKYTGNDTYRQLAEDAVKHIAGGQLPLPGLPGQCIDPSTGKFACSYVTWGGGSDSYFEYLIKYARLSNTNDSTFVNAWKAAVDSSIKHLLTKSTVGGFSYLADYDDNRRLRFVGSHLECFHAGNWLLGGKLLNNDTIVKVALDLNDACWNTYAGTTTGIGPEAFAFISPNGNFTGGDAITGDQLAFYNKHGYYITSGAYIERPEVLESNFYAWRVTGNTKYLDRAASAVQSFNKYLKLSEGYSDIGDVNSANPPRIDETESFWFAEVLKYLYLTFDDPQHISLDKYVFNTEAHPFMAPPAKGMY